MRFSWPSFQQFSIFYNNNTDTDYSLRLSLDGHRLWSWVIRKRLPGLVKGIRSSPTTLRPFEFTTLQVTGECSLVPFALITGLQSLMYTLLTMFHHKRRKHGWRPAARRVEPRFDRGALLSHQDTWPEYDCNAVHQRVRDRARIREG